MNNILETTTNIYESLTPEEMLRMKDQIKKTRDFRMVFVVNSELKMCKGKMAAQVAHCCLGVYKTLLNKPKASKDLHDWERLGAVKIVLKGNDMDHLYELRASAENEGLITYLVQDAGFTQVPAGSRTVLGIFGRDSVVTKLTRGLKLV